MRPVSRAVAVSQLCITVISYKHRYSFQVRINLVSLRFASSHPWVVAAEPVRYS